jgi:hypothetical protein
MPQIARLPSGPISDTPIIARAYFAAGASRDSSRASVSGRGSAKSRRITPCGGPDDDGNTSGGATTMRSVMGRSSSRRSVDWYASDTSVSRSRGNGAALAGQMPRTNVASSEG